MLMVIFGAGASYDSSPAFPPTNNRPPQGSNLAWRPPRANELFLDPNGVFLPIVQTYKKISFILTYLRQPAEERSVEEELEVLQAHALGDEERTAQLASVVYYLRDLLWQASEVWQHHTGGVTNYASLLGELLLHNTHKEPICLVTFNYDLLLDRALENIGYLTQSLDNHFSAHSILKLFKPHGSVDWARFVWAPPGTEATAEALIQRAISLKPFDGFTRVQNRGTFFDGNRYTFPCIAIPVQNKTDSTFAWPLTHRTYFLELLPSVRKILIIGWRAREAHFMELLRSKLRGVTHLMAVGSDTADSEEILQRIRSEIRSTLIPTCTYYPGRGGFTRFVVDHEGEAFLSA